MHIINNIDLFLTTAAILLPLYFIFKKGAEGSDAASFDTDNSSRDEALELDTLDGLSPIPVPARIYIAGALASVIGTAAYLLAPNGVSARTVIPCVMMIGGVLFILAARVFYGDAVVRRNAARGVVTIISFLLMMGGIYAGGLTLYGVFGAASGKRYLVLGVCGILTGIAGLYYSIKYHQNREAVAIGRRLGFADADNGPASPDAFYDSKGVISGMEVLFKIEQTGGSGTRSLPGFTLELLCRCANPLGVRLKVHPEGFLGGALSFSSLPKVPSVPYWDLYEVRSNLPDSVLKPLSEARSKKSIFSEETGFSGMSLDEKGFKFAFSKEGSVSLAYVKKIVEAASLLASAFK
ncbi:MAG: hypothetical protein HY952_01915 [Elusimicrobia bacterium]|nr:hypothetical protein [Elusimicrobiota bacterium]